MIGLVGGLAWNQLQATDEDRCRFMESLAAHVVHPTKYTRDFV